MALERSLLIWEYWEDSTPRHLKSVRWNVIETSTTGDTSGFEADVNFFKTKWNVLCKQLVLLMFAAQTHSEHQVTDDIYFMQVMKPSSIPLLGTKEWTKPHETQALIMVHRAVMCSLHYKTVNFKSCNPSTAQKPNHNIYISLNTDPYILFMLSFQSTK
jgi:hypothetical protein